MKEKIRDNKSYREKRTAEPAGKRRGAPVLALWALCARGSLFKVLAVLAGMALAETARFLAVCRSLEWDGVWVSPEEMTEKCLFQPFFLAAFGLVFFILLWTQSERGGSRSSYTLLRLKVGERGQFAVRTAYNVLCLGLVFAAQAALAAVLCRQYAKWLPEELVSPQLLFLAFYRNRFLHCLLPMADAGRWIKNLFLLLAFAVEAAREIRGRGYLAAVCLGILSAGMFTFGSGRADVLFCIPVCLICVAGSLFSVFGVIGNGKAGEK